MSPTPRAFVYSTIYHKCIYKNRHNQMDERPALAALPKCSSYIIIIDCKGRRMFREWPKSAFVD
ncbi:hypothetical protein M413DRAFT_143798 [Hebeloma cylindrosporum]|uniref:Uncharacterized protein n=1 Tax=Hebeloma cylindrosporum TaxID=76867 RepID=A0A0C2YM37_HEBCY|nr:hypothetical protein M413DRAFT_143798 [Hebeloma cylindrosporum h7]